MAKRNEDSNAFVVIFTLIFLGIILLIKLLIALIISLISFLVKLLNGKNTNASKKYKNKAIFNDDEIITTDKIKRKLGVFPKEIYDHEFMPQVIKRGEDYYCQGRIYDYNIIENIHTCKIKGTEIYDVSIMFNEEDGETIESMSCTCPHYMIHGQNCKHIYALLYKVKCEKNIKIIKEEIKIYCDMISDILEDTKELDEIKKG